MLQKTSYVLLLVWSIGCQKAIETQPRKFEPLPGHADVAVNLNGVDLKSQYAQQGWHLYVEARKSAGGTASCSQPGIDIQIQQFSATGRWLSNLSFWIKQDADNETIKLNDLYSCPPFVHFNTLDVDVSTGHFTLVPTAANFLQVEAYNQSTGELSCRFQATFVPKGPNKYSFLKGIDTLRFTDGRFTVKVDPPK